MNRVPVPAKINLALVVGDLRPDGRHEVATVLQRIDICDRIELEPADAAAVTGFRGDTLVRSALGRLAEADGGEASWRVRLRKEIPVAAGLGGGSADAAAALALANETLERPLAPERLAALARELGADVPFFLTAGPQLGEGFGERLTPLELPQDFWVLVALPPGATKPSTADVYRRFDELGGAHGFAKRKEALLAALAACRRPRDFAAFPPNDLAQAAGRPRLVEELLELGAFRADLSGTGPAVYGLFHRREEARRAARRAGAARSWVVAPVW